MFALYVSVHCALTPSVDDRPQAKQLVAGFGAGQPTRIQFEAQSELQASVIVLSGSAPVLDAAGSRVRGLLRFKN